MLEKFVMYYINRSRRHGLAGEVARQAGLKKAAALLRQALAKIESEIIL